MADAPRGKGRARGRIRVETSEPGPTTTEEQHQKGPKLAWGRGTVRASTEHSGEISRPEISAISGSSNGAGEGTSIRRGTIRKSILQVIQTRPQSLPTKLGIHGTRVQLSANYFKLIQQPNWCLYQHRVDMAPEEDQTRVKKALFHKAVKGVLVGYSFDGTVLYTANRLNPDPFEIFVQDERRTNQNFRFTIRLVGDVACGDFQYIQFFNILMRKCLGHLKLQLVGRNFYDAIAKISIPEHHIQLWPGYITSIRQHETSILMCAEITHKVMRHDTVLHLLSDCVREDRANYKHIFLSRIIGTVVLTEYNNRTYQIDDVDFTTTPTSTFSKRDGTSISYIQYYQERYNLRVSSTDQPMLISRAKAREIRAGMAEQIYLVPELCCMTGLTTAQRANFQLMRSLADYTRMGPTPRIQKLLKFSQRLNSQPKIMEELKQWDFKLAENLVQFSGRVLPPEKIAIGCNKTFSAGLDCDWTKPLKNNPMLLTAPITTWVVVCPSKLKDIARPFVDNIVKMAKELHWSLPFPKLQEIHNDRLVSYLEGIETALNNFKPEIVVSILPSEQNDRYSAIKKKCYVEFAIPSQVILAKSLRSKSALSIATKIAIQMNCKLGGAPWCIPLPYKNMMVLGFDVCHDNTSKERSYGALVASLNRNCTQYFSTVTAHTNGEELSNDIALGIIKATRKYQEVRKELPDMIVMYRDGVGDGQLQYVYEFEINNIRKRLTELYGSEDKYKLCFIVTSKRINTRIFTAKGENPIPGTVVDDVITLPERYDFFIVSQCVRQGTVTPTSYNVLFDNMGQEADKIQRLTYKLTHMYFNWSGTVRVPAPCQYAHKLAYLVGQHLHRNPHPNLTTSLFYL